MRQEGNPLRDRLVEFARSLAPTAQETVMIAAIALSVVLGAAVRHYREEYRLHHPTEASPTPRHAAQSAADG